jgi:hypothetical protein
MREVPMEDDEPRSDAKMPAVVWAILGILAVGVFVLVLGVLR